MCIFISSKYAMDQQNKEDKKFLVVLQKMRDEASYFWGESFSLELAAKAYFFLKFMERKEDDELEKFVTVCGKCGGENKFYGVGK